MEFFHKMLRDQIEKVDKSHGLVAILAIPPKDKRINGQRRKLFRNHPPEVQARAKEWFNKLLIKHKAKLEAKHRQSNLAGATYYGVLVATATHMAMRDLGLIISNSEAGRKGYNKRRFMSRLKAQLGMRHEQRISVTQSINDNHGDIPKLEVKEGNLEGV